MNLLTPTKPLLGVLAISLTASSGLFAATSHVLTSGGGDGSWDTAANWTNGVPNAAGDTAAYSTASVAATTALNISGGGQVTIGKISKTASGAWTINTGTASGLTLDNTGGTGNATIQNTSGSGFLTINAGITAANANLDVVSSGGPITLGGTITASTAVSLSFKNNSSGNITVNGAIGATGENVALSSDGTGSGNVFIAGNLGAKVGSITQSSSGTLSLSGDNSAFTGDVTINSGTVSAAATTALSASNKVQMAGGVFNFTQNVTIGGLNGSAGNTFSTGASLRKLTLSGSGIYAFDGTIATASQTANQLSRTSLAVSLTGSGKQTLTSASMYGGGTTVTSGTLVLNNPSGSATGTGAVLVSGGKLGGKGIMAPTGSNGLTVQTGASIDLSTLATTDTLTIDLSATTGGATFDSGSAFVFDLAAGNASDRLAFIGLDDSSLVAFNLNAVTVANAANGLYTLFTFVGGATRTDNYTGSLSSTISGLSGGQTATWIYNDTSIQLEVVPEPSTAALFFAGGLLVVGWMKRARRARI